MDIINIEKYLKYTSACGETLNIDEKYYTVSYRARRVQLNLALMKLQESKDFDELLFWGRIKGLQHDYYIALGIAYKGHYNFPVKKFYWATEVAYKFESMPQPNEQYKKDVDERDTMFTGDPDKILIEVKPPEQTEPGAEGGAPGNEEGQEKGAVKKENLDESIEVQPTLIPKNFTELDRLAFVVAAIENDTHVVPLGAFKLLPIHEVRRNENFKGR